MTSMAFGFFGGYLAGTRANVRAGRMSAMANSMAAAGAAGDLADLDDRIDRLGVVVAAMWSLLEEAGYTDEALQAKIEELSKPLEELQMLTCPDCEASVRPGAGNCQICGAVVGEADPVHDL